jgi:hypothetical protein
MAPPTAQPIPEFMPMQLPPHKSWHCSKDAHRKMQVPFASLVPPMAAHSSMGGAVVVVVVVGAPVVVVVGSGEQTCWQELVPEKVTHAKPAGHSASVPSGQPPEMRSSSAQYPPVFMNRQTPMHNAAHSSLVLHG